CGAVAAQHLSHAGLTSAAHALRDASRAAFLHSLTGACLVAAGVAAIGVLLVAFWLPNRPSADQIETGSAAGVVLKAALDQAGNRPCSGQAAVPGAAAHQGQTAAEQAPGGIGKTCGLRFGVGVGEVSEELGEVVVRDQSGKADRGLPGAVGVPRVGSVVA